jgi:hypothetical protein
MGFNTYENKLISVATRLALLDGGVPTEFVEAKAKMQRFPEYLEQAREAVRFTNTTRALIIPLRTNSFATHSGYTV